MIIGRNVDLRSIEVKDAPFVLSLRLNPNLNKYISRVEDDLQKQGQWIRNAMQNKQEWYFIVQNKNLESVGTIRIYDIKEDSFCWGSWIIIPEARKYATLESIVLLYQHAFFDLRFNDTRFDVRKDNTKALNFYLRFGAVIVDESDIDFFMTYTKDDFVTRRGGYYDVINKISDNKV